MVRNRFFVLLSFLLVCCVLPAQSRKPSVKPGIEVLRERGFEGLRGKRVGLVTNPSGVDSRLKSTIDILFEAPEVNLVALFGPARLFPLRPHPQGYARNAEGTRHSRI